MTPSRATGQAANANHPLPLLLHESCLTQIRASTLMGRAKRLVLHCLPDRESAAVYTGCRCTLGRSATL
jgi:hypothetical protein